MNVPVVGYSAAKIVIFSNGETHLITMFNEPLVTSVVDKQKKTDLQQVHMLLKKIAKSERIVWCKGIAPQDVHRVACDTSTKSSFPCTDVRSKKCLGTFAAGKSVPSVAVSSGIWICTECSTEARSQKRKKCVYDISSAKRRKIQASSNCPWKFLSTASQKRRRSLCANR